MHVDGDVAFDDARYGRSRVIAIGAVGHDGLAAFGSAISTSRSTRCRSGWRRRSCRRFRLAARFAARRASTARRTRSSSCAPISRTLTARCDPESRGTRRCGLGSRPWFDVDARLLPLSLAEVGKFAPAAGLAGRGGRPGAPNGRPGQPRDGCAARARRRRTASTRAARSISRARTRATISPRRCACSTRSSVVAKRAGHVAHRNRVRAWSWLRSGHHARRVRREPRDLHDRHRRDRLGVRSRGDRGRHVRVSTRRA